MTTIKLKNGSGAPTAGDLVQGEPALDLTNKRLYTENASGTVIEVGTNPTSITTGDITATGTATFANLATSGDITFGDNDKAIFGAGSDLQIYHNGTDSIIDDNGTGSLKLQTGASTKLEVTSSGVDVTGSVTADGGTFDGNVLMNSSNELQFFNTNYGIKASTGLEIKTGDFTRFLEGSTEHMRIASGGDISFYNDAGTSQDLYWDASTSRLGLGTTSPSFGLSVESDNGSGYAALFRKSSSDPALTIQTTSGITQIQGLNSALNATNAIAMQVSGGNVGIGTASPSRLLDVNGIAKASIFDVDGEGFIRGDVSGELHIQSGTTATVFRNNANNTEHMRIVDSSGNVGIGTSSPSSALTVAVDDATGDNGARIAGVTDGNKQLRLAYNTTGNYANIQAIHAGTAYTNLVLQKDGGNVGIGTTSPAQTLHVSSSSAGSNGIRISNSECSYEARVDGGEFYLYDVDDARIPLLINTSGNVGIGITNPSNPLTVSGSAGTIASFTNGADADLLVKAQSSVTTLTPTTGTLALGTSSTERMRIDSSGDLIVGGTSSGANDAVSLSSTGYIQAIVNGDTVGYFNRRTSDGEVIRLQKDGTTVGSIGAAGSTAYFTAPTAGGVRFTYLNSTNAALFPCDTSGANADALHNIGHSTVRFKDLYLSDAAYLDKVIGHDDTNTYISFIGSDVTQFVQGGAEAMRLNASGDLLLGVSSLTDSAYHLQTDTGGSTGAQINTVSMGRSGSGYPIIGYNCAPTSTVGTYNKHYVDYASWIQFISGRIDTYTTTTTASGTTTGTAGPYLSSGGTSWTSSSDRRLKDNIEGISYGLEAVKLLNPVSYVRNDRDTGATELGFIAQEVDEVVSEVVSVKDDGYYGIDYERLIPVLTKAIQDQQDIIENLKSRIEQLEGAN